jgi:hypothetical protein
MKLTLILAICLFQCAVLLFHCPTDVDAGAKKKAPKPQLTAKEIKERKDAKKPSEAQINAAKSKSKTELKEKRTQRKGDKKAKNAKKLEEQCVVNIIIYS